MKKWLWVLIPTLTLCLTSKAQTATQASDPYLTVQFLGYADGKYEFQLNSNQVSCNRGNADVALSVNTDLHISSISPNASGTHSYQNIKATSTPYITYITADWNPNAVFTFTELTTACNWVGNPTPLRVGVLLSTLPLSFTTAPLLEWVDESHMKVTFSIGDVSGENTLHIQLSKDGGKTFSDKAVILPTSIKPNSKYTQIIAL